MKCYTGMARGQYLALSKGWHDLVVLSMLRLDWDVYNDNVCQGDAQAGLRGSRELQVHANISTQPGRRATRVQGDLQLFHATASGRWLIISLFPGFCEIWSKFVAIRIAAEVEILIRYSIEVVFFGFNS